MKMKGSIISGQKIMDKLLNVATNYEHEYKQHLGLAALAVHSEAVKSIRMSTGSKADIRFGPKRVVRVSNPGEAPNTDTGTAIKSIGWNVDTENMAAEVGTNLKYLKWLEFGTQTVAARPWLFPALEAVRPKLMKIFRRGRGNRQVADEG